jgi:hypothetical protein
MNENISSNETIKTLKKNELYKNEQINVLIQILKKIGLTKNNLSINKDDIENEENKDFIRNKKFEIKYFYYFSNWTAVISTKNFELNLLRYICRYHNIKISIFVNQKSKNEIIRLYNFEIPDEILNLL